MDPTSSLGPEGKPRPGEERWSRVTHAAGQTGQGCRPLGSHEVLREGLGILPSSRSPPSGPQFPLLRVGAEHRLKGPSLL